MNAALRQRLRQTQERVDNLSLRERAIVFVAVLALLYAVAVNFIFPPLNKEKLKLERELKTKQVEISVLQTQIEAMLGAGITGADSTKQAKLNDLQDRLRVIDQTLGKVTTGLVTPQEMPRLVREVLAKSHPLALVKLENLPPAPLVSPASTPANAPALAGGVVYKHGLRVELKGDYFAIARYLHDLERMPWKVFWGEMQLSSDKTGPSQVSLTFYTLSTREGWIAI
jgi:MSHA biogenesis protein MshJ